MPKVICKKIGCKKLVEKGINYGYCDEHKDFGEQKIEEAKKYRYAQYDKTRDKKLVNFYHGTKWKQLRDYALARDNYLCQDCLDSNRLIAAEEVHHIIEVKDDWSKRYDKDNLVSLCKSCHRKRHRKY
jgi:5-methylcytosine-specific restriction protein A|nr:MAG TPA: HNH endonuclease [Caudoviricetes sp.]